MKEYTLLCSIVIGMIATANAQVTTSNNTGASTDYVGWAASEPFDLNIRHKGSYNINFHTNGSQYMQLTSGGLFGIGYAFTPSVILDIAPPALNNAYGINGQTVLQNWGTSNIFTGVGTGASLTTGVSNSFFGDNAGFSNQNGSRNTFLGHVAGYNTIGGTNNVGSRNTFVGDSCGFSNTDGYTNGFVILSAESET